MPPVLATYSHGDCVHMREACAGVLNTVVPVRQRDQSMIMTLPWVINLSVYALVGLGQVVRHGILDRVRGGWAHLPLVTYSLLSGNGTSQVRNVTGHAGLVLALTLTAECSTRCAVVSDAFLSGRWGHVC